MKFDNRSIDYAVNISPLDLKIFLPCMAGLLLFVGGIVVGRTFPNEVTLSANSSAATVVKAHGRFGVPRWNQQRMLVADIEQ